MSSPASWLNETIIVEPNFSLIRDYDDFLTIIREWAWDEASPSKNEAHRLHKRTVLPLMEAHRTKVDLINFRQNFFSKIIGAVSGAQNDQINYQTRWKLMNESGLGER